MKWLYFLGLVIAVNLGDGSLVHGYIRSASSGEAAQEFPRSIPRNKSETYPVIHRALYYFDAINPPKDADYNTNMVHIFIKNIASDIAIPNIITNKKTLTNFKVVTRIIRTLDYKSLNKIVPMLDKAAKTRQMFFTYRSIFIDALSQAGSRPAFLLLSHWISEKTLVGEEAAEALSVIPNSPTAVTIEYLEDFFNLAKSEVVTSQQYLNVSAILSFTNLVRKSLIKEIYTEGIKSNGSINKAIIEKYIPYLANQLNDAAVKRDSPKIQVYIRALGNTGHKDIFSTFEQYLQGKHSLSDFQRLVIISSLDKIAKIFPALTRTLLYNIYINTGETQELRVAAVIQIMKTNPPAQMLQRMAEFTNYDLNNQVASVVKSAIEEAARLNTPRTQTLAKNAKSAVHLLTTREFGVQYSKSFTKSFLTEKDTEYQADFSYIQQKDSVIPSSIFYNHNVNIVGFKPNDFQMNFMSSSSDDLINFILDHIAKYPQQSQKPSKQNDKKWSWDTMADGINFKLDHAKDVEGNILIDTLGANRFFPFDNKTIKNIQDELKHSTYSFREGKKVNLTKFYNPYEIMFGFPMATGYMFYFTLGKPTFFQMNGEIVGKAHPDLSFGDKNEILMPVSINATVEMDYLYSSKIEGQLGFYIPFTSQTYISRMEKNIFIRAPIYSHLDIDLQQTTISSKIRPIVLTGKTKLFECSSTAFTEINDIRTSIIDDARILQPMKTRHFKQTFGSKAIGLTFDLQMEGQHKGFHLGKIFSIIKNNNEFSKLLAISDEDTIINHNLTLSMDSKMGKTQFAKLLLTYSNKMKRGEVKKDEKSEEKESEENGKFQLPTDRSQRLKQLHKNVSQGIAEGQSTIIDAQLSFNEFFNYVATGAYSSSSVSNDYRFMLWLNKFSLKKVKQKSYQVSLKIDSVRPKVAVNNYKQALDSNPTSLFNVWLNYGQDGDFATISTTGILKRSTDRMDFLKSHPVSRACLKDMKYGNNIQPVCRNVTDNANFLDQYEFDVFYRDVPECCKHLAYKAYSLVRHLAYPKVSENNLNTDEKTTFAIRLAPNLKHLDVFINTPDFSTNFQNISIDQILIPLLVSHPEISRFDRFSQKLLPTAVCSVDEKLLTTFDNRQFHYQMGDCWQILAISGPKPRQKPDGVSLPHFQTENDKISIAARSTESSHKELVAIFGKNVVEIKPRKHETSGYIVKVNNKQVKLSESYENKVIDDNGISVKLSLSSNGFIKIEALRLGMKIIFDGSRVALYASNRLRNRIRGICGNFDGEDSNDFMTTKKCILKDPHQFITSYTLHENCSDPHVKETLSQISKLPCSTETDKMSKAVYDESGNKLSLMYGINGNKEKHEQPRSCKTHIVRVVEPQGKACFSIRPRLKCRSHCKPTKEIEETVDFHCFENNLIGKQWIEMVKKGGNPGLKDPNHREKIKYPEDCVPK